MKGLLQINIDDNNELKMILNKCNDLELRGLVNFLEHLVEELNNSLDVELEDFKGGDNEKSKES